jgi:hypothetical protein
MKKSATIFLAAALGSGLGFGTANFLSAADAPRQHRDASAQNVPQLPNGFQMKELNQIDNIRSEISKATAAALDAGHFGDFVDHLATFNRDQMKDWKDQDFKTLDGVIEQINKDWNQKYGHDFKITSTNDLWTDHYTIVQGVVTEPNVAADNFPVPAEMNREGAQAAAHTERGQARDVVAQDLKDSKNVALVRFPSERELPDLTASMIEEGLIGKWRFAIPVGTTSLQLHTQLQNQLTYFGQQASQWPADENQAYRLAAHRVAMAMYNVQDRQHEQTQK